MKKPVLGILSLCAACAVRPAEISLGLRTQGPTPSVLAYNLGHFHPGSNAADWWRFSGATGARAFFSPRGFELKAKAPPHDAAVTDLESFLDARERLQADPLNERYINWTELRRFFQTVMPSENRMTIEYALENILPLSPDFLVQMNMQPDDFPVAGPDDWAGKWRVWRSYFSFVYHFASAHGMERFAMQNEPNHPHTFVEPDEWLMRAALTADAAERAVDTANRLRGTELRAKMYVPKLAGGILNIPQGAYASYSRPILQAWGRDFLGRETGRPLYYAYAHQPYNHAPDVFAHDNDNVPHNYGGPTRAADVYRLFIRAFRPGRDRLALDLRQSGALRAYASRDPETGSIWIFAVNPANAQPVNLDLFPWAQTLAGHALVEEVSEKRGGEVVAVRPLEKGRLGDLTIPSESVWLLHFPGADSAAWVDVGVEADTRVVCGNHCGENFGAEYAVQVANDPNDASERSVGFFRFQLPDIPPERVLAALVEFQARLTDAEAGHAQAQVFVSTVSDWEESSLTWSSSRVLRQNVPAGSRIPNRVVQGQGDKVFVAGQVNVTSAEFDTVSLDVTDLLRERGGEALTLLVAQEPRWNVHDGFPDMNGDIQGGGLEIASREQNQVPAARLRLLLRD